MVAFPIVSSGACHHAASARRTERPDPAWACGTVSDAQRPTITEPLGTAGYGIVSGRNACALDALTNS